MIVQTRAASSREPRPRHCLKPPASTVADPGARLRLPECAHRAQDLPWLNPGEASHAVLAHPDRTRAAGWFPSS